MSIVKVSIFQKGLEEGLSLAALKKLAALRSDFLLLPEYFFADASVRDHRGLVDRAAHAEEWLLKLADAYRGIVLGGSLIRRMDLPGQESSVGVPLISDGQIIDWYRKRILSPAEQALAQPGTEAGIYILKGFRFGVLAGDDAAHLPYLEELADQGIRMIFLLQNGPNFDDSADAGGILRLARERGLCIARCSAAGKLFGQALSGRSCVATPAGISWQVSAQEGDREILKTVLVNISN